MKEFEHKRRIMSRYDQTAETYDKQYLEEQNAKIRAALKTLTFNPSCAVLDLGCGTGLLFPHMKRKARMLVGLDFSQNILKQAKKRAADNILLVRADADYTPFRNHVFDSVFAFTLLQNMPNPAKTLDEIKRVSKPGGRIIVTALKKSFPREKFLAMLRESRLEVLGLFNEKLKGYVAICRPFG